MGVETGFSDVSCLSRCVHLVFIVNVLAFFRLEVMCENKSLLKCWQISLGANSLHSCAIFFRVQKLSVYSKRPC